MDGQAPAASALQLSTFTTVPSIPRSEKYPDFPVTVCLTAPGLDQMFRAPVDIVAAIDVSMSSKTNDRTLELEKAAMNLVIDKLGPHDRLAILPFSDGKSRVMFSGSRGEEHQNKLNEMSKLNAMTNVRKRNIRPLVEALAGNGGTKLSVPIIQAEKILSERGKDDRNHEAFIILLSDGEDPGLLKDKVWSGEGELMNGINYRVHTFGFAKPNTETLKHIATITKGTPFDVEADLQKFDDGFETLLTQATSRKFSAVGATASLKAEHPGVFISRIDAGGKKSSIDGDARSGDVEIGVIKAGETPDFIVYLDVPVGDADADVTELLDVSGAYTQGWDGKHVNLGPSLVSVDRPVPPSPEPVPPSPDPVVPGPEPQPVDPCKDLDKIEERLKYWCKVKKDLFAMDEKMDSGAGNKCQCCHVTAVQRQAAQESINRAMHVDIYTAVVQIVKMRRCSASAAAEQQGGGDTTVAEGTTKDN